MNEPTMAYNDDLINKSFNEMNDEEFTKSLDHLKKPSAAEIKKFMSLMSNNKPKNEKQKSIQKKKNRAKNKVARKSRMINKK